MSRMQLYDHIGNGYANLRRPDPRIAAAIETALGDAGSVVNVGAGAGSYEPRGRAVVAIEPSVTMIRQRSPSSAPCVRAMADALPFGDDSFDAALAVLTIHHWSDLRRGLEEMARVARGRLVQLTWDPEFAGPCWLVEEYFPGFREIDQRIVPRFDEIATVWGEVEVIPVPVPHDCSDGFAHAYWRRPSAYLDADVRGAISTFSRIDAADDGLLRLARDLESGAWERRHSDLLELDALDLGYRLVVAR